MGESRWPAGVGASAGRAPTRAAPQEGKVLVPDAQLQYRDPEARGGRVNVEVVSEHYSEASIAAKIAAALGRAAGSGSRSGGGRGGGRTKGSIEL